MGCKMNGHPGLSEYNAAVHRFVPLKVLHISFKDQRRVLKLTTFSTQFFKKSDVTW